MIKNKKAAMEMSVGTIVTIVLLMAVLVLGLTMTRTIFRGATENIKDLDSGVKQGTENFGIPLGFSPNDPNAWGTRKDGCIYSITPVDQPNYCIGKGWNNIESNIVTGTRGVDFDELDGNNGYALIKMSIPESIPPCLQRFQVDVGCEGENNADEYKKISFDIEVIKRGLF